MMSVMTSVILLQKIRVSLIALPHLLRSCANCTTSGHLRGKGNCMRMSVRISEKIRLHLTEVSLIMSVTMSNKLENDCC